MKHLKKFNEMFDPMGSWNPKDFTNNNWNTEESDMSRRFEDLLDNIIFDDQNHPDNNIEKVSILDEIKSKSTEQYNLDNIIKMVERISTIMDLIQKDHKTVDTVSEKLIYEIDIIIDLSSEQEDELKTKIKEFLITF